MVRDGEKMKKKFTKERFYKKLSNQQIQKKCDITQKGIDIAKTIVANQTEIVLAIQQRKITLGEMVISMVQNIKAIKKHLHANT